MEDRHGSPLLVTNSSAAQMLAVCEKTLWSRTYPRGPIPCVKIGRSVRYAVRDLEEFIESQKQGGDA